MILENESCTVKIDIDETYTVDSADNRYYDAVLNTSNYKRGDLTKTLAIHIDSFSEELHIALIGPCYMRDIDCAILENDVLTVLAGHTVTQIRITDGSVIRHVKLDCYGYTFAIYKVEKGFVIYGEMAIIMLYPNLVEKWSFSGEDVFVSVSGKTSFEITESSICLRDFMDNYYEIDFEGNRIK